MPLYGRGRFAFLFTLFVAMVSLSVLILSVIAASDTIDQHKVFSERINGKSTGHWGLVWYPNSTDTRVSSLRDFSFPS